MRTECSCLVRSISSAYATLSPNRILAIPTCRARLFSLIQAHGILFPVRGSWVGNAATVCAPRLVSPSPTPMSLTSHGRLTANSSIARTNVSMVAGKPSVSLAFRVCGCTVVNLVSCRLLAPHVPCPVPRPVNILAGSRCDWEKSVALEGLLLFDEFPPAQVFETVLDQFDPQGLDATTRFLVRLERIRHRPLHRTLSLISGFRPCRK